MLILPPLCRNSNKPCGKSEEFLTGEGYQKLREVCYNGEAWHIVITEYAAMISNENAGHHQVLYHEVPGMKQLTSKGGYFGLTAQDIVASSVEGWKKNGKKQGYKIPKNEPITSGDKTKYQGRDLTFTKGVREPGFFSLSVCPKRDDMAKNAIDDSKPGGEYWPCK